MSLNFHRIAILSAAKDLRVAFFPVRYRIWVPHPNLLGWDRTNHDLPLFN